MQVAMEGGSSPYDNSKVLDSTSHIVISLCLAAPFAISASARLREECERVLSTNVLGEKWSAT